MTKEEALKLDSDLTEEQAQELADAVNRYADLTKE